MSVFVFRAVPVFNVVVPTLLVGFLFSGTVFFVPAMNLPVFISEVYFWSIFVSIMFVVGN